jgi:hypothetical protein
MLTEFHPTGELSSFGTVMDRGMFSKTFFAVAITAKRACSKRDSCVYPKLLHISVPTRYQYWIALHLLVGKETVKLGSKLHMYTMRCFCCACMRAHTRDRDHAYSLSLSRSLFLRSRGSASRDSMRRKPSILFQFVAAGARWALPKADIVRAQVFWRHHAPSWHRH